MAVSYYSFHLTLFMKLISVSEKDRDIRMLFNESKLKQDAIETENTKVQTCNRRYGCTDQYFKTGLTQ